MNKVIIFGVGVAVLFFGGVWWSSSATANDPTTVATKGIHWHPQLEIYIANEKIEIPQNVGLVNGHNPIHTHDDLPNVHLEFDGIVTHDDIKLQRFFDAWDKDIHEFGENVLLTVNGVARPELGEYEMQDGDKMVLRYE